MFSRPFRLRTATLDVSLPFGKTLTLGLLYLVLALLLAEFALRQPAVQARLLPPGRLLPAAMEIKLRLLAERSQPPDCFVLGSSVVNSGIHAAQLNQSLAELDCFNFSVPDITIRQQAVIVEFVLRQYQPRLIILGTYIGDFNTRSDEQTAWIHTTPWLLYQRGQFSPQGWLIEHSAFYRAILAYRGWARHSFASESTDVQTALAQTGPDGSNRNPRQYGHFHLPPDPALEQGLYNFFNAYVFSAEELAGLDTIVELAAAHSAQLVVVELPFHTSLNAYLNDPAGDYASFEQPVAGALAAAGIPFLQLPDWTSLPDEAWANRNHLNGTGADLYTEWLAGKLPAALTAP